MERTNILTQIGRQNGFEAGVATRIAATAIVVVAAATVAAVAAVVEAVAAAFVAAVVVVRQGQGQDEERVECRGDHLHEEGEALEGVAGTVEVVGGVEYLR